MHFTYHIMKLDHEASELEKKIELEEKNLCLQNEWRVV